MENILWGYILFMSVLTFSVCGVDKFAAQRQKRRVPEKVLFGPAHHPDPGGSAALFCAGLMLFLPNR